MTPRVVEELGFVRAGARPGDPQLHRINRSGAARCDLHVPPRTSGWVHSLELLQRTRFCDWCWPAGGAR